MISIKKILYTTIIVCFPIFLKTPFLTALDNSNILINTAGFSFKASFMLHHSSSDLIVKLKASHLGRKISLGANGPILAVGLGVDLHCTIDGKKRVTRIVRHGSRHYKFYKMDVPKSSVWYSTIKKLAKRAATKYDNAYSIALLQKSKSYVSKKHSSQAIQIKARPGCSLKIVNCLRTMSLGSRGCLYPQRVLVSVSIHSMPRNKEELLAIASLRESRAGAPKSVLKFVYKKNRLKQISRKHLGESSIWISGIKEAIKRNIKTYRTFKRIFERKLCNSITQKSSLKIAHTPGEKILFFTGAK